MSIKHIQTLNDNVNFDKVIFENIDINIGILENIVINKGVFENIVTVTRRPPDTPRHPPDIPKTPPRYLQGTHRAIRCQQTLPDTPKH